MPEILEVAARFRAELEAFDDAALRDMSRAYAQTWTNLEARLDALTEQIQQAIKDGKVPVLRQAGSGAALGEKEFSVNWLYRQARYQELLTQCEAELQAYSRYAARTVQTQQQLALDLGLEHSANLMQVSLGPTPEALVRAGIRVTWNQAPKDAFENLVGFLRDGSPLSYKFAQLPPEVGQGIRDTFAAGFAQGNNPRAIAGMIQREYAGGLSNALTVCRTETLRAYRTAAHENYRANADVLKGWIRTCARQIRTCAACWAEDGTFHPLTEELNDHVRGRCTAIPVTKSWAELYPDRDMSKVPDTSAKPWNSETAFAKLSESDQRFILGPAKFDLWSSGKIRLADITTVHKSEIWGDSIGVGKLSDVLERAGRR